MTDLLDLTRALIDAESITPATGAVFDVLEAALVPLGFNVDRFIAGGPPHGPVENLLAVRGAGGTHFAFAGHLDVVPPGKGGVDMTRASIMLNAGKYPIAPPTSHAAFTGVQPAYGVMRRCESRGTLGARARE